MLTRSKIKDIFGFTGAGIFDILDFRRAKRRITTEKWLKTSRY
jgi:hypothetical protein